jgi:hypothetical protein
MRVYREAAPAGQLAEDTGQAKSVPELPEHPCANIAPLSGSFRVSDRLGEEHALLDAEL